MVVVLSDDLDVDGFCSFGLDAGANDFPLLFLGTDGFAKPAAIRIGTDGGLFVLLCCFIPLDRIGVAEVDTDDGEAGSFLGVIGKADLKEDMGVAFFARGNLGGDKASAFCKS